MNSLENPVEKISGIGPKMLEKLTRLGIKKTGDFINHFPNRYEDFSNIRNIKDLLIDEKATVAGKIIKIGTVRIWKRKMTITEAKIEDETGVVKAVWFNQPYIEDTLKEGLVVNFSGKVLADKRGKGIHLSNPIFEISDKDLIHTGGLVAIYPETRGLTSRWLRLKIKSLLEETENFEDFLPEFIREKYKLIDQDEALRKIHFPQNQKDISQARRRLAFNELFLLQLFGEQERRKVKSSPSPSIVTNVELIKKFISHLPYKLTDSQRLATWQILQDLETPSPMNRLLEGDVGSGKTVVATIVALNAVDAGYQVAIMAPTEILAQQHFVTIKETLSHFHREVALLTRSESKLMDHPKTTKKEIIEKIAKGEVDILIGTHSLIQKEVNFKKLGLLILDEQHRFGVEQRARLLRGQEEIPHLLSMTATPIPRTLALAMYGDLDISLLKEMPEGRKEIITKIVAPVNRKKAYEFIKKQIDGGHQAFVICPLVEESEKMELRSVEQEYEKLNNKVFPNIKIGMLHGRLKAKEKADVMKDFTNGKTKILISTAVVEVGVDIKNATVMMIEGSDRFGLAQLHQFRGRVGRAEHQSYCFLFTDSAAESTNVRLKALVASADGFALAEKDLQIRGPGEFFGTKQSGLPDLAMASLKDVELIEETQKAVKYFLDKSDTKKHPAIAERLKKFQKEIHWE